MKSIKEQRRFTEDELRSDAWNTYMRDKENEIEDLKLNLWVARSTVWLLVVILVSAASILMMRAYA
jgi:hypothetical protein